MNGEAFEFIDGTGDILIVADHASNRVPADIDLGVPADLFHQHVAIDLGVAEVARMMAAQTGCLALLGGVSRLVIDYNREEDAPGLMPLTSDGHAIPGNEGADVEERLNRFHRPYHSELAALIRTRGIRFLLSLHSFTPSLQSAPDTQRPWEIGILYNQDDRAARIAIPALAAAGLNVGDQQPYSGVLLNATMNRHGEANAIPYLGVEMRQNEVADEAGQRRFAALLAKVVQECRNALA